MRPATLPPNPSPPDLSVWRVRMECPNGGAPISLRVAAATRGLARRKVKVSFAQLGRTAGRTLGVECLGPVQASTWPDSVR